MGAGKNVTFGCILTIVIVLLTTVSATGQTIVYVDENAAGTNTGTSWENAYNYLQDALASAQSSDEIWIAQGTYKPNQGIGQTSGATFNLKNGVDIYGGYAGFGKPNPNTRDIELYKTILSGDLDDNDLGAVRLCQHQVSRPGGMGINRITRPNKDTFAILAIRPDVLSDMAAICKMFSSDAWSPAEGSIGCRPVRTAD